MPTRHAMVMVLAGLFGSWSPARVQLTTATAPATKAAVGPFDMAIVKRAAALLPSAQRWNRVDTGNCPRSGTTYSVRCALRRAVVEAAELSWTAGAVAVRSRPSAARVNCSINVSPDHSGGSCGTLWDEVPVLILSRAKRVTSGAWRKDAQPTEVWAGTMADAEYPVNYESRHGVTMVSGRRSSDPLIDFNNDSTTTFDDVRSYFRALEARVLQEGAGDLDRGADQVEIEVYEAGNGIIRTYNGWFAVSGLSVRGSTIRFQIDTTKQIAPNALDREILVRAAKIISTDSAWNRADDRECPAAATKWSIYCAVEQAQIDVAGAFHHRRPAGELIREIVDERTKTRNYRHRMMDYNNDPTTTLADVHSLFAEAIARIQP